MEKLIAVVGDDRTGKTSSIKILLTKLMAEAGVYLNKPRFGRREVLGTVVINGTKVGVTSRGDVVRYLNEDFYVLDEEEQSVIVVCACHPTGKTIEFVRSYEGREVEVIELDKTQGYTSDIESEWEGLNYEFAELIFERLF